MAKWLICGSRTKENYSQLVHQMLDDMIFKPSLLIEGCCPNSADVYAEEWAKKNNIPIQHFPSSKNNYLKRNIEMINELDSRDFVIAFWDGYSYGTAHTISWANSRDINCIVVMLNEAHRRKY